MKIEARTQMPVQDPVERIRNFDEVALGYSLPAAIREADRCLGCKDPPCVKGCPVGVKIPSFISRIKAGDIDGAYGILRLDNNLPAVCGRVCPQENQCEKLCVRNGKLLGAVSIGALERFAADNASNEARRLAGSAQCKPPTADIAEDDGHNGEYRVAIVGSGPASLTCAADLAVNGVKVTVFEALHKAGGVLMYGIPQFRLPKALVESELEGIRELGVDIKTNVVVGRSLYISELLDEFDAVFIGSGAGLPTFMGIEGEGLPGVYSANEYLTRVNLMRAYSPSSDTPLIRGKRVVVVGAGNVAMDSARTARRLGADVTLVYRRSRAEMPARAEEIRHAEEEGVAFELLVNPVKVLGEGRVEGVRLVRMSLAEPDSSGRRRPVPVPDSEFDILCDQLIVALGTTPNPIIRDSEPSLATTAKGAINVDEMGRTSMDRVYAGGDATTGAATVILAMGAGKRAAKCILDDLKNRH